MQKIAVFEYTEEKSFKQRLEEALKGTGISLQDLLNITSNMFVTISFIILTEPNKAGEIVGRYVKMIFELGVKYAVENPNAVKITYEEE